MLSRHVLTSSKCSLQLRLVRFSRDFLELVGVPRLALLLFPLLVLLV